MRYNAAPSLVLYRALYRGESDPDIYLAALMYRQPLIHVIGKYFASYPTFIIFDFIGST